MIGIPLRGLAERGREVAEALDRDGGDDRVPVREVRVDHRLAVFDLAGQATDRHRSPAFALRDRTRRRDDTKLTSASLLPFLSAMLNTTPCEGLLGAFQI